MKKLLTIMVLALALCLICSAAMAATILYTNYQVRNYNELAALVGTTDVVTADGKDITITSVPTQASIKVADHGTGKYVNCYGYLTADPSVEVVVEIYMKSTHRALTVDFANSKAETCGANGVAAYKCLDCAYTTSSVVEKTGLHTYETIKEKATCQHGNIEKVACTVCGDVKSLVDDGAKTGCVYDSATVIDYEGTTAEEVAHWTTSTEYWAIGAPSCSANDTSLTGSCKRKCVFCKVAAKTNWAGLAPNWVGATTDAKMLEDYRTWMQNHGVIVDAAFDGHNWDAAVEHLEATCGHAAGTKKWCKRCSLYVIDPDEGSAPLDPVWTLEDPDELTCKSTTVSVVCLNCGGLVPGHAIPAATVTKVALTQVNNGYGTGTKYTPGYTATISDGGKDLFTRVVYHKFTEANGNTKDWDFYLDKAPTAASTVCDKGVVGDYKCKICGDTTNLKWDVKTAAPGHDWSKWKLFDEGNGLTDTKRYERVCSVCKTRQVKAFATAPIEHKADGSECTFKDDPNFKYTCGALNDVLMVCACGNTKIDYNRYVEHAPGAYKETIYKQATCKEDGLIFWTCKNCNKDGKYETIAKNAKYHVAGAPIVTAPTLEADGSEVVKCTVCGAVLSTKVLPKLVPAPQYTLTAEYSGSTVTGQLKHVAGTQDAAVKNVRVTFYIEGNYYMATMAEVAADGSFSVDGVGPIKYITVAATGNTSVNPEDYQKIAEAQEIFVD